MIKKDIEILAVTNQNMRVDFNDLLQKKDTMDRHSRVLLG